MKARTVSASCALVAMFVAGTVTTIFAQDGRYRLSGSGRYSKVPTDARLARLKDANDRFNSNYGNRNPAQKPTAIRINEAGNTVKPFQKTTPTGGIGSNANTVRPNTLANGSRSTYLGSNRPGTTASSATSARPNTLAGKSMTTGSTATSARPNSLAGKGMTTARTATSAKPITSAAKGPGAYRNLQTARSAKQVAQGVRTAKTVVGATKAARLAMGATGVGVAGFIATEIVLQEIEDPGKTLRDINGTAKDIETGQFLPKAGQKLNQAGKDVGNFVNGIFGKKP